MSLVNLIQFSWQWSKSKLVDPVSPEKLINAPLLSADEVLKLGHKLDAIGGKVSFNPKQSEAMKNGEQTSRFLGSGMEYEESRPYEQGDEIRRLNWKLMAKTGQAYTKLYQEERQENWFILLDHRKSMRFGTRTRLKATQATRIAGYYAWLAQQAGIPVSIGRLTAGFEQSPIFEGRTSYSQIMQVASQACPPDMAEVNAADNISVETHLYDVLLKTTQQLAKGSRLILISDFHDMDEAFQQLLSELQNHFLIKAVLVKDVSEESLPNVQGVQLQSSVNGQIYSVQGANQRQAFENGSSEYFAKINQLFMQTNASFFQVRADQDIATINRVLQEIPMHN